MTHHDKKGAEIPHCWPRSKRRLHVFVALLLATGSARASSSTKFEAAHVKQHGQDMIFIPVQQAVGRAGDQRKLQVYTALQACSRAAGIAGTVVMVIPSRGRAEFYGPKAWHEFLSSWT